MSMAAVNRVAGAGAGCISLGRCVASGTIQVGRTFATTTTTTNNNTNTNGKKLVIPVELVSDTM
jgi:hypothetical protein